MSDYDHLLHTVGILAAPAERQVKELAAIGMFGEPGAVPAGLDPLWNIDEIALQFEDAAVCVDGMMERGDITQAQADRVKALDDLLSSYSGERFSSFWTVSALGNDPRWEEVRRLARDCLNQKLQGARAPSGG